MWIQKIAGWVLLPAEKPWTNGWPVRNFVEEMTGLVETIRPWVP